MNRNKNLYKKLGYLLCSSILLTSCGTSAKSEATKDILLKPKQPVELSVENSKDSIATTTSSTDQAKDSIIQKVEGKEFDRQPNESGTIMIHLFHRFIEKYEGGDKTVTITLDDFRKFLNDVYEKGYRTISMQDYIDGNIAIPKGCIPMIITFDDGWSSQFQFIEENGVLKVDPSTAVGVLEEFNETHPDFALKGVFYVNLGKTSTFGKVGTLEEKMQYLIDKGFEISNHTLDHNDLKKLGKDDIILQIGKNQKLLEEALPNYKMKTLALPYGSTNKDLVEDMKKGSYDGVSYANEVILLAGAEPSKPRSDKSVDLFNLPRVLSPGIESVFMDSNWWLDESNYPIYRQYVSDGDPETLTIPKDKEDTLSDAAKKNRKIILTDTEKPGNEATPTEKILNEQESKDVMDIVESEQKTKDDT